MTSKVIKANGRFEIVPSGADIARAKATQDKTKFKDKLTDGELRALLDRILDRIEALENS